MCDFELVYIGRCPEKNVTGAAFCKKHNGKKCSNPGCSNQATTQCYETGSLVCGAPICSKCGEHKNCPFNAPPSKNKKFIMDMDCWQHYLPSSKTGCCQNMDRKCPACGGFMHYQAIWGGYFYRCENCFETYPR